MRRGALCAGLMLVMVSSLSGCERIWSASNRGALERDVASVFEQRGLGAPVSVRCEMVAATRDGVCEVEVAAGANARLVEALELAKLDASQPDHRDLLDRIGTTSPSCLGPEGGAEAPTAWVAVGRPRALAMSDGTAFEYLLLVRRGAGPRVCLQLAYAYG